MGMMDLPVKSDILQYGQVPLTAIADAAEKGVSKRMSQQPDLKGRC
jgi:hypothetical protein